MTDRKTVAKRRQAGKKARAVAKKMQVVRAALDVPRGELFEYCAQCGRPLGSWYWRPVEGRAPLTLEKVCADCAGEVATKPKECRL